MGKGYWIFGGIGVLVVAAVVLAAVGMQAPRPAEVSRTPVTAPAPPATPAPAVAEPLSAVATPPVEPQPPVKVGRPEPAQKPVAVRPVKRAPAPTKPAVTPRAAPEKPVAQAPVVVTPAQPAAPALQPRVIEFTTAYCSTCKLLKPVLKSVQAQVGDQVSVEEIDINEHAAMGNQYRVKTTPTIVILDRQGEEAYRHLGYISSDDLLTKLKDLGLYQ